MKPLSKKAEIIALTSLVMSAAFFILTWLLGEYTRTFAMAALGWFNLAGVLVWGVLALLFHQRSLAEQEKMDMSQMARTQASDTIFQAGREQQELFAVAQRRLAVFEKWFLPALSFLIAAYQIGMGVFFVIRIRQVPAMDQQNPQLGAVLMVAVAFVSFLLSRYATGMSAQKPLRHLRAGGGYLMATSILSFILAILMILAHLRVTTVGLTVMNWVVPVLLLVLAAETIISAVFDFYRPRVPGQENRLAFDSRILGLFNEPGGVLHTFASTIDYQFGFKVSQTWFYRLLEKAIIPLFLFGAVSLYLLSCLVVVNPGEEAVIEHLGSFQEDGRHVGAGLHVKWPWPFDRAYVFPASRVQILTIGYVEEDQTESAKKKPLLWGEKHFKEEYDLLVAATGTTAQQKQGSVPVSLVRANVPVHYHIRDLKDYVYNNKDARRTLEAMCYRELSLYAASARIETETEGGPTAENAPSSLLGAGRVVAGRILQERIQKAADEAGLGIDIVFLGLQGVHPPPDIAGDYQDVIASLQKRQAAVLNALADKNSILSKLAGSIDQADELYSLARDYQQAKEQKDAARIDELEGRLIEQFSAASGEIFKTLAESRAYAFQKAVLAEATGKRFNSQLQAFRASPRIYQQLQRLLMLEEALATIRKYVVIAEEKDAEVYIVDLQEKLAPDLYDIPFEELGQGNR